MKREERSMVSVVWLAVAGLCSVAFAGEDTFASSGYSAGAANYLRLPLHGPAAALGGAVTAWSENLTGLQYNPAVLDAIVKERVYLNATYRILALDRKHMGAEAGLALGDYVAVAFSVDDYSVKAIEGRDEFGVLTRAFNYREGAVGLTAAGRLKWPVSLGATLRYLYGDLADERANGFGFDLGAIYHVNRHFRVGLSGRHIASYTWWTTGTVNRVDPTARLGLAGMVLDSSLTGELDVVKPIGQPIDVLAGIQYRLINLIFVRAGIGSGVDIAERDARVPDFSFGVGMRYKFLGFDYALEIPSSGLGLRHTLSVVGMIPVR